MSRRSLASKVEPMAEDDERNKSARSTPLEAEEEGGGDVSDESDQESSDEEPPASAPEKTSMQRFDLVFDVHSVSRDLALPGSWLPGLVAFFVPITVPVALILNREVFRDEGLVGYDALMNHNFWRPPSLSHWYPIALVASFAVLIVLIVSSAFASTTQAGPTLYYPNRATEKDHRRLAVAAPR